MFLSAKRDAYIRRWAGLWEIDHNRLSGRVELLADSISRVSSSLDGTPSHKQPLAHCMLIAMVVAGIQIDKCVQACAQRRWLLG
jgi:hypothetical protein